MTDEINTEQTQSAPAQNVTASAAKEYINIRGYVVDAPAVKRGISTNLPYTAIKVGRPFYKKEDGKTVLGSDGKPELDRTEYFYVTAAQTEKRKTLQKWTETLRPGDRVKVEGQGQRKISKKGIEYTTVMADGVYYDLNYGLPRHVTEGNAKYQEYYPQQLTQQAATEQGPNFYESKKSSFEPSVEEADDDLGFNEEMEQEQSQTLGA
jgi:single-stranded DNA-binding protein